MIPAVNSGEAAGKLCALNVYAGIFPAYILHILKITTDFFFATVTPDKFDLLTMY